MGGIWIGEDGLVNLCTCAEHKKFFWLDLYPVVSSNHFIQGNIQHTRWLKLWSHCLAIHSLYLDHLKRTVTYIFRRTRVHSLIKICSNLFRNGSTGLLADRPRKQQDKKKKSQCRCQITVSHWWQNVVWTVQMKLNRLDSSERLHRHMYLGRALACLLAHKTVLGFKLSKSIFNESCNHPMHWTRQSH